MVASPESQTPRPEGTEEIASREDEHREFTIHRDERQLSAQHLRNNRVKADERNELHPYVQSLSLSDLESCLALENAVFPPLERCTREKVGYIFVVYAFRSLPSLLFAVVAEFQWWSLDLPPP